MIVLNLIPKVMGYKLFRYFNIPGLYPFNLTISVTNRCNSKCKTCNIWKEKYEDLSLEEWHKILKSIGKCPIWVTISGGEPFLREDLVSIVRMISKYNKPYILNIATNGILTNKIESDIKEILSFYNGNLIVNVSMDGVNDKHDFIRGIKCFNNVLETYNKLRKLDNLTIGMHTVISKYNVKDIPKIYGFFKKLNLDSFICEIAENREELKNINMDIAPSDSEYFKAIDFLLNKNGKGKRISKLTKLLRKRYYKLTKDILKEKKAILPCYAGMASAHVNFKGDLWACCIKCETFGNLRKNGFKELWFSEKANKIRDKIKNKECYCTLANASYSNIICGLL
ncbi:MAG: radical SAM/SPASM domain-containing protein [Candidatus Thorarchaeota archaeon]